MNFKKALMTLAAAASFAASAGAAPAGIVNVPFAFKYLNQQMPAGRYYFHMTDSPSAVLLTNLDGRDAVQVAIRAGRTNEKLKLIFNQKGTERILRYAE
jgi:hypothetical protein